MHNIPIQMIYFILKDTCVMILSYRLRIANLCCAMEEKMIFSCLQGFKGIEDISVNIIGRYSSSSSSS